MSGLAKLPSPLRIPELRRPKFSGRAVVTLVGRDIYLGPWGSKTSKSRYRAAIAEWMNAGSPRGCAPKSKHSLRIDELVAAYWQALEVKTAPVSSLRIGEQKVREGRKVLPAKWEHVEPVLGHVSQEVAAMIQLQWWTGARSGKLVGMCPADLDRSGVVWLFRPKRHKTQHQGRSREIAFGPRAKAVPRPFLDRVPIFDLDQPIFSPARAEQERFIELGARRETRVQPSQQKRRVFRKNRRRRAPPARSPRQAYDSNTYARAIHCGITLVNALTIKEAIKAVVWPQVPEVVRARVGRFLDHMAADVNEKRIA